LQSNRYLVSRAKLAAQILLLAAAILSVVPCRAAPNTPNETGFRTIYDQFVSAVRANDKNKIADLIAFPVNSWSVSQKSRVNETTIPNRGEFLAKYESLFTPFMRSHALRTKPQQISADHYIIVWHDEDSNTVSNSSTPPGKAFDLLPILLAHAEEHGKSNHRQDNQ
jgi:hypothetical protein